MLRRVLIYVRVTTSFHSWRAGRAAQSFNSTKTDRNGGWLPKVALLPPKTSLWVLTKSSLSTGLVFSAALIPRDKPEY